MVVKTYKSQHTIGCMGRNATRGTGEHKNLVSYVREEVESKDLALIEQQSGACFVATPVLQQQSKLSSKSCVHGRGKQKVEPAS